MLRSRGIGRELVTRMRSVNTPKPFRDFVASLECLRERRRQYCFPRLRRGAACFDDLVQAGAELPCAARPRHSPDASQANLTGIMLVVRRLLVEELLVDPVEGRTPSPPRYVEDLGYSLAPDGRPYVEATSAGETRTVTKIASEDDDSDQDSTRTRTFTFVAAEEEDWEARLALTGTETRIGSEDPDRAEWAVTRTLTKIQDEAEDRD